MPCYIIYVSYSFISTLSVIRNQEQAQKIMSHLGERKAQGKILEEKIGYHIRCRVQAQRHWPGRRSHSSSRESNHISIDSYNAYYLYIISRYEPKLEQGNDVHDECVFSLHCCSRGRSAREVEKWDIEVKYYAEAHAEVQKFA